MSAPHSNSSHAWLHDLLHHLEHILPAQAPIKDFVHHNTLHGFQHLPFREALAMAEAITGNHGYQSPEAFRAYFRQGRIDLADLDAALDETPELRADAFLPGAIARRAVLRAGLQFDLRPLPDAVLKWRIEEAEALDRCQAEISEAAKAPLMAGQGSEGQALKLLWQVCGELLSTDETAQPEPIETEPVMDEASVLWQHHRLRQVAERRLSELNPSGSTL